MIRRWRIYQRPSMSKPAAAHKSARTCQAHHDRANQSGARISPTFHLAKGFLFTWWSSLNWVSRVVPAWRLSNTLGTDFCVEALEKALVRYGRPEIFNADQGLPSRKRG